MKFKFLSLSTAMVAVLGFGSLAIAQDTNSQNAPQAERGMRRGGFGKHHGGDKMRGFAQLNVSEAQRQQIRTIMEASKNSAQREELRQIKQQRRQTGQLTAQQEARVKELREQMKQTRERNHGQILAILTPEQRTQLEALKAERSANRGQGFGRGFKGERGMHRGGFRIGRLNLSETQQQQLRTLNESLMNSTRAQREELRQIYQTRRNGGQLTAEQEARTKQLREQLRQASEQMRASLQNILTPEQRQQLEQQRQQMQERRRSRQNISPASEN